MVLKTPRPRATEGINIAEWLAQPYVDAVPWREAADGDLVLLRDPSSRGLALADAYVIDGVVRITDDGKLDAYTKRVQGPEPRATWSYRKAARRVFAPEAFQVWRNFRREITTTELSISIDDMAGSDITIRRALPNYVITVDNGYIEHGGSASIELTPDHIAAIVRWLQS